MKFEIKNMNDEFLYSEKEVKNLGKRFTKIIQEENKRFDKKIKELETRFQEMIKNVEAAFDRKYLANMENMYNSLNKSLSDELGLVGETRALREKIIKFENTVRRLK